MINKIQNFQDNTSNYNTFTIFHFKLFKKLKMVPRIQTFEVFEKFTRENPNLLCRASGQALVPQIRLLWTSLWIPSTETQTE